MKMQTSVLTVITRKIACISGEVTVGDGNEQRAADPGVAEDTFNEHRPADDPAEGETEDGDAGEQGVASGGRSDPAGARRCPAASEAVRQRRHLPSRAIAEAPPVPVFGIDRLG